MGSTARIGAGLARLEEALRDFGGGPERQPRALSRIVPLFVANCPWRAQAPAGTMIVRSGHIPGLGCLSGAL